MRQLFASTVTGAAAAFLAILSAATAQDMVITADKVFTGDRVIENGAVVITDGKISSVGQQAAMSWPEGTPTREAAVVTPGFIDARTVVGIAGLFNVAADQDADETTDPNGAELRVIDAYNASEGLVRYVRQYGVTAMHVTPGDANPIGGQTALVKTVGDSLADALIDGEVAMMFSLGERPKSTYGGNDKAPSTRMATAALLRSAFLKAQHWLDTDEEDRKPDLESEALSRVRSGDLKAIFAAHREDDIATAMRLGEEFGFDPIIAYGTEGYLMAGRLGEQDVPVIVSPVMGRAGGRMETLNASLENARLLKEADVPIAFATHQEGYVPKTRVLLFEAAIAVANGLPDEDAIRAMTLTPATMFGVDDRMGSLAEGKEAHVVAFDGDPFEYTSHVTFVMIDGNVVHERQGAD